MKKNNVDQQEVQAFSKLAFRWWDKEGEFKPLHEINPLRLEFIEEFVSLKGKKVLDVGCGGGILAESMAEKGADVSGIDAAQEVIEVAKLHLLESGHKVDYACTTAEDYASEYEGTFDVVCCMEMLEHVPDPKSVIEACSKLVKPGGHVFFSTINRNLKAYFFAIVGAEYVLNMLPKGTHTYEKFIKPSELFSWVRAAELLPEKSVGMHYQPFTREFSLGKNTDVNYLVATHKPH